MESRELRIGNILREKHTGDNLVVLELTNDRITFDYQTFTTWQAETIQLTEEILLKCGFEKVRYEKYAHVKLNKLRAYPHVMKYGFCIYLMGSYTLPHIKYLHQLQNLYFALTGQELEIKL